MVAPGRGGEPARFATIGADAPARGGGALAIDRSPAMIAAASARNAEAELGAGRVRPILADAGFSSEPLGGPLPSGRVRCVVAGRVR